MSETRTLLGFEITVADKYAEGHVVTAAEAAALNQTRAENMGNQLRSKIKALPEAERTQAAVQALFDELSNTYEFGIRKPRARVRNGRDPIETEARQSIELLLLQRAEQEGKTFTAKELKANVQIVFERDRDKWMAYAVKAIERRRADLAKLDI